MNSESPYLSSLNFTCFNSKNFLVSFTSEIVHVPPAKVDVEDELVGGDEDAAAGRRREVLGVAEAAVRVAQAGILTKEKRFKNMRWYTCCTAL